MKKKYKIPTYDKSSFVINPKLSKNPLPISVEQQKNHDLLNDFLKNAKKLRQSNEFVVV